MEEETKSVKINDSSGNKIIIVLAIVALLVTGYNQMQLFDLSTPTGKAVLGIQSVSASDIIPTGTPEIYGSELGISYDDISPNDRQKADAKIKMMSNLDKSITLQGADLERYINILYRLNNGIACEYCCGARSVIFEDGKPACGCAHSYAMRGLTKYLITEHGSEYTDEEILEEVGKWKTLFFPGILEAKAQVLKEKGIEVNYINLASNKYRGIEKGATSGSGMVGGC